MSGKTLQPSRVQNVVVGGLIVAALIMAFASFGELTKFAGSIFLFIPDKLGVIEQVSREEVLVLKLDPSATTEQFEITKPGRYVVYTNDIDLLSSYQRNNTGSLPFKIHRTNEGCNQRF
jgi:hypothetical protein